ncbi:hypothetical protein ABTO16_18820, partial [Acinetobacter baumannii]
MDLLTATLQVPEPPAVAGMAAGTMALLRETSTQIAVGALLLVLGLLLGRASVRRPLPPVVEEIEEPVAPAAPQRPV